MSELDTLTMEQAREMDNDALRVLVARLLDYRLYEGNGWHGRYVFGGPWLASYSEEEMAKVWAHVRAYSTPEEAMKNLDAPDWPDCLDDAAKLVQGTIFHAFTLSGLYDFGWSATIRDHKDVKYVEHARQPARAVTLAWVAWRLRQGR